MSRTDDFGRARAELDALTHTADAAQTAALYLARWPKHPPDYFLDTGSRRRAGTLKALGDGEGWAARLVSAVPDLHVYHLQHTHLSLPAAAAAPGSFLRRSTAATWKRALKTHLSGPLYWCLELGDNRVHLHALAGERAGLLELPRGGKLVEPVYDLPGILDYLNKPPMAYNAENLALWLDAKQRGPLPNLSGTMRLPNKRTWANRSASVHTFTLPVSAAAAAATTRPRNERPDDAPTTLASPATLAPDAPLHHMQPPAAAAAFKVAEQHVELEGKNGAVSPTSRRPDPQRPDPPPIPRLHSRYQIAVDLTPPEPLPPPPSRWVKLRDALDTRFAPSQSDPPPRPIRDRPTQPRRPAPKRRDSPPRKRRSWAVLRDTLDVRFAPRPQASETRQP